MRYVIRDREHGNEIDSFATVEGACDELTKYVLEDEKDECDMAEYDIYVINDRRNKLMEFYEIYDEQREEAMNISWDGNDNCVVF